MYIKLFRFIVFILMMFILVIVMLNQTSQIQIRMLKIIHKSQTQEKILGEVAGNIL